MANELSGKVVVLTTTSFQDTPGLHQELLSQSGAEIIPARGPLTEEQLLALVAQHNHIDGFIAGDDRFTDAVLQALVAKGCTRVSKYGIGVDAYDLEAFERRGVSLTITPGVNHTTVAEHVFALALALTRKVVQQNNICQAGEWKRLTGNEIASKALFIMGFGRIGKEVAKRAMAFGMRVMVYDPYWSEDNDRTILWLNELFGNGESGEIPHHQLFTEFPPSIWRVDSIDEGLEAADFLTLHMPSTDETRGFLNAETLGKLRRGAFVINTARGDLVDEEAVAAALDRKHLGGYATDVVSVEPITPDNPLLGTAADDNLVITAHIGSRTPESVARQGSRAVTNLIAALTGGNPDTWKVQPPKS